MCMCVHKNTIKVIQSVYKIMCVRGMGWNGQQVVKVVHGLFMGHTLNWLFRKHYGYAM